MQPNNYLFQLPDPSQSLLQGMQTGNAILGMRQQQQLNALALQQKQAEMERIKKMRQDLSMMADNPSYENVSKFQMLYPDMADKIDVGFKNANEGLKKRYIDDATQIMAAIQSGNNDTAIQIANDKATMFEQSGRPEDAQGYRQMAEFIKVNPKEAFGSAALMLSRAMGADKYSETYTKLMEQKQKQDLQPSAISKAEAEAKKEVFEAKTAPAKWQTDLRLTNQQIAESKAKIAHEARKLNIDEEQLNADIAFKAEDLALRGQQYKLNDASRKIINDSVTTSVTLSRDAENMNNLAAQFENLPKDTGRGMFTTAAEYWAKATGRQDALSLLRKEYVKVRMSEAIKLLPPGPATDKDVALAQEPFLGESSDAEAIASQIRGLAKINMYNSKLEEAKAEWVNQVGGLNKANNDIDVLGVKVAKGSSFADFSKKYIRDLAESENTKQKQQAIPNRSYNRFNNMGQ